MPDTTDTHQIVVLQDFVSAMMVDSGSEITVQWSYGSDERFRAWRDQWRRDHPGLFEDVRDEPCTEGEPCRMCRAFGNEPAIDQPVNTTWFEEGVQGSGAEGYGVGLPNGLGAASVDDLMGDEDGPHLVERVDRVEQIIDDALGSLDDLDALDSGSQREMMENLPFLDPALGLRDPVLAEGIAERIADRIHALHVAETDA